MSVSLNLGCLDGDVLFWCSKAKTYQRTHPKKMSLGHKEWLVASSSSRVQFGPGITPWGILRESRWVCDNYKVV